MDVDRVNLKLKTWGISCKWWKEMNRWSFYLGRGVIGEAHVDSNNDLVFRVYGEEPRDEWHAALEQTLIEESQLWADRVKPTTDCA